MANHPCPDCAVAPGERHVPGCDVERCPACGWQRIGCQCRSDLPAVPWTGVWPGEAECREFGWFARWIEGQNRWERCAEDTPGAGPDLNRLYGFSEARWDRASQRWIKR